MKNVKYYICLLNFMFWALACTSQNFAYKKVNNTYEAFVNPHIETKNVLDYLPRGYVTDGSVDYTEYIQKAIDENNNVEFPNFPLLINDKGIRLKSNSNVVFDRKSSLILKPTAESKYSVVQIYNVKNVTLYNPTLIGDRKNHKGEQGEWGMGIRIQDSEQVKIYNVNIKDMWGDGIYITSYTETKSNNILIKNGWIDNVRRNGISIISGKNITIDSVQISNTNGTHPAAGIDVEPNTHTNVIDNLKLMNILTLNNQKDGIVLSLRNLVHAENRNTVTVHINNHEDRGSRYALRFSALKGVKRSDKVLKGKIVIENSKWTDFRMKTPLQIGDETEQLPEVILKNIQTNIMSEKQFNESVKNMIKLRRQFQFN